MRKSLLYLAFCSVFILQGLVSCNEEDPEPIVITAEYPSTVKLKSSFSNQDTLKFKITSEASILFINLYENNKVFANLDYLDIGVDTREFSLKCLYNPNSVGVKNLKLSVKTIVLEEDYLFNILVEE